MITTEDKIRLCMSQHAGRLAVKQAWVAPASLLVTIVLVLLTADFHDAFSVEKASWKAVFLLTALLSLIWSVYSVYHAIKTTTSVDTIVDELKQSSPNENTFRAHEIVKEEVAERVGIRPSTSAAARRLAIQQIMSRTTASGQRSPDDFVGKWRMAPVHNSDAFTMTLNRSFIAHKDHVPSVKATWELIGDEAHVRSNDGWLDVLQLQNDGTVLKIGFRHGNRNGAETNRQIGTRTTD